ncbi:uncharacterized protein LOC101859265 [Aplysia californica]|uniref:Uncharacterized protein LOC101859265 n=1 Tax=Aplysia californica TaxID=6500 RepID=A0ABM0K262_APLCA|nr:uncharacterized protein LOC101859265 [Aplysia californica]
MANIFVNVEADIADDLVGRFCQDFDFDAMLRKVCEDAGVVVVVNNVGAGAYKLGRYRLKGLWLSMEKAYKHLVTALALYGSRHPDAGTESYQQSNSGQYGEPIDYDQGPMENYESLNDRDYIPAVTNILQDILTGSERKKQRRPRKSARQSRKLEEQEVERSASEDESYEDHVPLTSDVRGAEKEAAGEAKPTSHDEMTESIAQENVAPDTDRGEDVQDCSLDNDELRQNKRGRPRKSELSMQPDKKTGLGPSRIGKKRGPYKKTRVVVPISEVGAGDLPTVKKRGRPKVFENEGDMEYPCPDCSFVAKKRTKLRSHQLRMHLSSPTKCDICSKVFPNKRYMLRHRASHVEPQHCCDVCGKMYKIRKAMLEHRRTHDSAYKKPKFKCDQCPKTFCNRYILECHVRDIHLGQKKSYLCSVCGKSFTTKHSLKEHSDAHTGVKPHVCEICGKSFSYESALRDHRFTHTDSKQFWCQHCEKGFSQRSGLKMHMRIHKQNKMFTCSECGRGFTQKQALQRHERVHKGEKPFICKHCGRFFTDASIIRRHLILVHKIKKTAKDWREDIVCTVKSTNEYHVQKIGEEDGAVSEAEKAKEEILKVVGVQPRPNSNKGPSRAFARTYPRRVAILDDEGNVLAPPEAPPISASRRSKGSGAESTSVAGRKKATVVGAASGSNPPILLSTNEGSSDLDSTSQVLSQRFMDTTQWDALATQLRSGNATHIEHIILDDSTQHEIQRGMEQVPSLHKIIKYENMQTIAGLPASNNAHILSQGHSQAGQSPSSSPVAFVTQTASNPRPMDAQFDSLTPQVAHTGGQFYDGRPSAHAASTAQWSSMFYYSHLASQFGMSINPDYTYVSGGPGTSGTSSHLAPYVGHSSADAHAATATALILHSQPHGLPHIDSPNPDPTGVSEDTSSHHGNQASLASTVTNPGHSVTESDTVALHPNSEVIQIRHIAGDLKMSNSPDTSQALQQTDMILPQDLPPIVDAHHQEGSNHGLSEEVRHHMSTMEHVGVSLGDQQNMMVGPLELPVSAPPTATNTPSPSKQSPTRIPELGPTASLSSAVTLKQEGTL